VTLFVFASLLEVRAVARAIERDFALLTTTLWADAPVNGRAESLLFPLFADSTAHRTESPVIIMAFLKAHRLGPAAGSNLLGWCLCEESSWQTGDFRAFLDSCDDKNRIKRGENATFPQDAWYKMRISQQNTRSSIEEDSWLQV
jgi:hypothetical protein